MSPSRRRACARSWGRSDFRFRPKADWPLTPSRGRSPDVHDAVMHHLVAILLIAATPGNLEDAFGRCLSGKRAQAGEFPAILDCYTADYRREDRRLNAAYRRALSGFSTARRRRIIDDQRRWIKARDKRCMSAATADGDLDTQDGRLAELSCLTLETSRQADRLARLR